MRTDLPKTIYLKDYTPPGLKRWKRISSAEILDLLGYSRGDELVHRDDMVVNQ
jgi:glutamate 5-kinase